MEVAVYETETPTVLVVDGGEGSWVARALAETCDCSVVDSIDAVLTAVEDDQAVVDCVVTVSPGTGETVDLCATLGECRPNLPVVVAPETGSVEEAAAVTGAGATAYLPASATDGDALRERVLAAVDEYDEDRQRERERTMFRGLLEHAPLSIYVKDRAARHVAVSAFTANRVEESLVGKTDLDVWADDVGEEAARAAYADDLAVIESGEPIEDKEERHTTGDGQAIWLRTSKLPFRDDEGAIRGILGVTRNVTEVKEREIELEREKRRLQQFASFASHDLRNPVNIARGYLQRAIETDDPSNLEEVAESLDRMDRLIDDLLDMVAPSEDSPAEEWTSVAELAERTWEAAPTREATLRIAAPEDAELLARRGSLRQVFENLFTNAVEHGGTEVTVEVGTTETGFYVADDGPGIPQEHWSDVFDYGFTTGGSGIGLAIVREIAEDHDWTPRVTDSASGGARFEFDGIVRRPPPEDAITEGPPVALDRSRNVGDAEPVGEVEEVAAGGWEVRGGGRNVWDRIEEYHGVFGSVTGDARAVGRITHVDATHPYAKTGFLLGDAEERGQPLVFFGATASHGPETVVRPTTDDVLDATQYESFEGHPTWYRIDRVDDRVTCAVSPDGSDWTYLAQFVVDFEGTIDVGLATCSHSVRRLCTGRFEAVSVVPIDVDATD